LWNKFVVKDILKEYNKCLKDDSDAKWNKFDSQNSPYTNIIVINII